MPLPPGTNGAIAAGADGNRETTEHARRWVDRGSRGGKRSGAGAAVQEKVMEDPDELIEEVTVAQRFSVHFHHVMARCALRWKQGVPMTAKDAGKEIGSAADHWAGDHSRYGGGTETPRCVADNWGPESVLYQHGSRTHIAFKEWLEGGEAEMRPYPVAVGEVAVGMEMPDGKWEVLTCALVGQQGRCALAPSRQAPPLCDWLFQDSGAGGMGGLCEWR
ncbi:unnamed protein product [Closterium sp. NIES-65]|nr:unnamed protein product [Closterium sp. NIES-65]